ncbi:sucrase ferredoxin [Antrihabitans cavernicola]|uniref:Sucrase ferredoxin n=1 Tax=Antrihabitans cavernicola TaxID=2495913 RepID=A0A5A7S984_9NOCA|nr:sucrase ferredoxin [Spelaeibacter cavernicola]KAA0022718.1 sucrase ferredoxin [Spelaeibacter cavernicola]
MTIENLTCSALSAVDEPLPGTAAHVKGWLCVEHPGAWGRDVLDDAVLGRNLSIELARRTAAADVRLMLIRRVGRTVPITHRTVLLANSRPSQSWCERMTITSLDQLLEIDLGRLGGPAPGIGAAVEAPPVLVCVHGKRDQCCARLGRPIAAALAQRFPAAVWECSHTGGHRFAPSMILLPSGYTYGRLDIERSGDVVKAAHGGEVSIDGLRGRSCYSAVGQAAEVAVRQTVLAGADDLTVIESSADPVVVHRDGRRWAVKVTTEPLAPRPASCGAVLKPGEAVVVESVREL